jgi:hypothetical protein
MGIKSVNHPKKATKILVEGLNKLFRAVRKPSKVSDRSRNSVFNLLSKVGASDIEISASFLCRILENCGLLHGHFRSGS